MDRHDNVERPDRRSDAPVARHRRKSIRTPLAFNEPICTRSVAGGDCGLPLRKQAVSSNISTA
jgi:hypothetical protein